MCECSHSIKKAFQLPDARGLGLSEVTDYFGRDWHWRQRGMALQNRNTGLEIRALKVGYQPPFQPRAQALIEGP